MKKIYHLEIIETGEHLYFGSIRAMFYGRNLGVTAHYFYKHKDFVMYKNKVCIIRKSEIQTTTTVKV